MAPFDVFHSALLWYCFTRLDTLSATCPRTCYGHTERTVRRDLGAADPRDEPQPPGCAESEGALHTQQRRAVR